MKRFRWAACAALLTVLLMSVQAFAQETPKTGTRTLTITVPDEKEYVFRPLPSPDAKQQAQLPTVFHGPKYTVTINPEELGKSPRIAVDSTVTGNTALLPLPKTDALTLHRSDFDHVRLVEVKITFEGKPVQSVQATLTPADGKTRTQVVDPSRKGVARFEDVPAGKAKLTLLYGDRLTETRDVDVTTDHPGDHIVVSASVANRVPTLEEPVESAAGGVSGSAPVPPTVGAPNGGAETPAPAAPSGGGLSGAIGTLLGLAVAAGAIYLLWRWAQSGGMAATLKKAGIEVSGPVPPSDAGTPWQPNTPVPPVVADPSLCPFCGQTKDAAGNCACALAPGAGPALTTTTGGGVGVATQPRLVATMGAYSGSIFPIASGAGVTVGRDPSNAIALADDTTVSRRHASIRLENGAYIVADEGSSNGVYVNGARIAGSQPLRPGDEVQIGNTRFRFEV